MSRIIVPLHLANLAQIPSGADTGFKKLYLRANWMKLHDGISETDLVLDRPLDNFTPMTGTITALDTVLTALEKLQYALTSLPSPVLNFQDVTDNGNTTTNSIVVAGITSGNFYSDGYSFGISDNFDTNYNLQYMPYTGLILDDFAGNQSILSPYGLQLNSGTLSYTGGLAVGWSLPGSSGTIALTSDIPSLTGYATESWVGSNYYPLSTNPAGYLTLGTLPTTPTPTLQVVTTAGNTTTNTIKIGTGGGFIGTYFLLKSDGFENYFTGGYNHSEPSYFKAYREDVLNSNNKSFLNIQSSSSSLTTQDLTYNSQILVFSTELVLISQANDASSFSELRVLPDKITLLKATSSYYKKINLLLDNTTNNNNYYFPVNGGTLALTSDIPTGGGLPAGGTAGQILTKIDATDYNATWQENYADWTSVVKHTVKNNGVGLITKGTPVYVTSSDGTNMLVGKASNTSEATSSKTMGLMQSNITTTGGTQTGFVITEGLLGGLNTAGTTAGDPVWLGVNGALIYGLINKPYAPAHLVFIGIVTKVSAGNGEIFVKVQNGFELKEIHDVDLITTTPSDGEVLTYEISSGLWKNKPASSGFARAISSVSTNTNAGSAASTDYVYLASSTINITLPTAVSNTNLYTIKNVGTGVVTIDTTSSQTIDGSLTAPINLQYQSLTLVSDGANWNII